jgi:hypothetical protein
MRSTSDILGGYINFLICYVSKATIKTALGGYLDDYQ